MMSVDMSMRVAILYCDLLAFRGRAVANERVEVSSIGEFRVLRNRAAV